ncbi:MAG TPA: DUF4112 domain-containing protein [Vicinamibacterales bacterium]|nr:DUF4112 domain-containing protein [Vicinamibacterales bacterium]
MFETVLLWLAAISAIVLAVAVAGYFALRWAFMRAAERMAAMIDRRIGGAAAHAFTGLARFAAARGISIDDANRLFGRNIDHLAKIMDSAITLPILGRVGLDAVLDLIPGVGNLAGAAISLTLIARTLQYGPPPSLVSKMLSNVLVDVMLGAIPLIGPLVDVWFKANERNSLLMREFLSSGPKAEG